MIELRERADNADAVDVNDPMDSTDAAEPTEPIESTDPTEPIESTDPRHPMQSRESSDHNDHFELMTNPCRAAPRFVRVGTSFLPGFSRPTTRAVVPGQPWAAEIEITGLQELVTSLDSRSEDASTLGPREVAVLDPFSVEHVHANGDAVIRFVGELDLGQAERAEREAVAVLAERAPDPLIVDLRDLHFCDSSGIRTLLRIESEATQRGSSVVLRTPNPQIRRVLELVGLLDHFAIQDDGPVDPR